MIYQDTHLYVKFIPILIVPLYHQLNNYWKKTEIENNTNCKNEVRITFNATHYLQLLPECEFPW